MVDKVELISWYKISSVSIAFLLTGFLDFKNECTLPNKVAFLNFLL